MEKRRTSMRLREPPAKRHDTGATTEGAPPTLSPKAVGRPRGKYNKGKGAANHFEETPQAEEEAEEKPKTIIIPNKLVEGQPLPWLPEQQSKKLKDSEWQSVADRYACCVAGISIARN
jgi:hypothetical protein